MKGSKGCSVIVLYWFTLCFYGYRQAAGRAALRTLFTHEGAEEGPSGPAPSQTRQTSADRPSARRKRKRVSGLGRVCFRCPTTSSVPEGVIRFCPLYGKIDRQGTAWGRPTTTEAWLDVAQERVADARILANQGRSVAAVDLAGYAVECALKAYLQRVSRGFPTSGQAGHYLRELWKAFRFRLTDLGDSQGNRTYFVERWNTVLRYNVTFDTVLDAVTGIRRCTAVGWVQGQIRRFARR